MLNILFNIFVNLLYAITSLLSLKVDILVNVKSYVRN